MSDIIEEMGGYLGDGSELDTPNPTPTTLREIIWYELSEGLNAKDVDEAVESIQELIDQEKRQAVLNFYTQYKAERINHTLSTKADEWKRELDHLAEFYDDFCSGKGK